MEKIDSREIAQERKRKGKRMIFFNLVKTRDTFSVISVGINCIIYLHYYLVQDNEVH